MIEKKDAERWLDTIDGINQAVQIRDEEKATILADLTPVYGRLDEFKATANSMRVTNYTDANRATLLIKSIKADVEIIEHTLAGPIDRLFSMHRAWTKVRAIFLDVLNPAAKTLQNKVIEWEETELRKANAERARLQAIEDERARKGQARLAAEAAKLKSPEKKAERLEQAAAVQPVVVQIEAPRATGIKGGLRAASKVWVVDKIDMGQFLAAAIMDENIQGFITIEQGKLQRAKAVNKMLTIPGVTFKEITR